MCMSQPRWRDLPDIKTSPEGSDASTGKGEYVSVEWPHSRDVTLLQLQNATVQNVLAQTLLDGKIVNGSEWGV